VRRQIITAGLADADTVDIEPPRLAQTLHLRSPRGPEAAPAEVAMIEEVRRDKFVPRWHMQRARIERLTTREYEVLMLLERGLDNLKISRLLDIGERTVKLHLTQILRKLGVESRLQAGLVAAEHVFLDASAAQLNRQGQSRPKPLT
jgi:DNA-binding NarL/FixJ family response regulator